MLITNGKQTRNIAERQLPEYERKGYTAVVAKATAQPAEKKAAPKKATTKKAGA